MKGRIAKRRRPHYKMKRKIYAFAAILLALLSVLQLAGCEGFFTDYSPENSGTAAQTTEKPFELKIVRKKDRITIFTVFEGKTAGELASAALITMNTDDSTLSVLQIPVNIYFGDEGSLSKYYKDSFAAASAGGSENSVADAMSAVETLIEDTLAVDIDYTAHMTKSQIISIIDTVGGIKLKMPYAIGLDNGTVINKGNVEIDGERTFGLMTYGRYSSEFSSELHIHKFLFSAFFTAVKENIDGNVLSVKAIEIRQHMTTTLKGTGGSDMFILKKFAAAEPENIKFTKLACENVTLASGSFSVVCRSTALKQINEFTDLYNDSIADADFDPERKLTSDSDAVVSALYGSSISIPAVYTAKDIADGKIVIK